MLFRFCENRSFFVFFKETYHPDYQLVTAISLQRNYGWITFERLHDVTFIADEDLSIIKLCVNYVSFLN